MADGGYDVADPCDVDPMFGTLADFDALVAAAHERRLRVTVDIVPNHFSDQHVWFQAALAAGPGSPERERFIFREGRGESPPNNWPSVFGGPAWSRLPDGQWYLHLFAPEQPDLDLSRLPARHEGPMPSLADLRWDRDGVHDHLRMFRRVLDSYPGDRMAVGEAWVPDDGRLARYVRPDELNLAFNFRLVQAGWGADAFRDAIDGSLSTMAGVGAPCTWVLSNHDVVRHVPRYGGGALGLARGRAAALVQLSLPGATYVYNGDELGLPNVDLPDSALQDPTWERSGHTERGRDGERVPLPWDGSAPPYGFTTGTSTWLPMPGDWSGLTVEAEAADPDSTLSLYQQALALRRKVPELRGEEFAWLGAPDGCLAYRRGPGFVVVLNAGDAPAPLPAGEVLLASGPLPVSSPVPSASDAASRT